MRLCILLHITYEEEDDHKKQHVEHKDSLTFKHVTEKLFHWRCSNRFLKVDLLDAASRRGLQRET